MPRKFSRYCPYHFYKMQELRHLDGRVLTKGELRWAKSLAEDFITQYQAHPAVRAALDYLADLLTDNGRARWLGAEFRRLKAGGATPDLLLSLFLAMWIWQSESPRPLPDEVFDLNLGRAVLRAAPAGSKLSKTGKRYYVRVRGSHAAALGRSLRQDLGLLGIQATSRIKRAIQPRGETARQKIREGLSFPFDSDPLKDTGEDAK